MEACDFCREINGNKTPCWICSLGNPCLGCEDYYIGESEKDSKCLSNGGCAENKENKDETN